jgi:hypothetical protein
MTDLSLSISFAELGRRGMEIKQPFYSKILSEKRGPR